MKASLSPERRQQLQRLFDEIADLDGDARAARLDETYGDDPDLREEVELLLATYEQAGDPLDGLDERAHRASQTSASASLRTGMIISHYEIIEKLGGGGMGVVYKARDTRLKRIVALKFLPRMLTAHEEARQRFEHEAQAASALDHPNICIIHDIGQTDDGHPFIAMAYYNGETLKKKIARGPMPVDEALGYTVQVARGLAKAHEKGIVHRDVKPANVMVTDDGDVKIVDFGLAKMDDVALTRTGATLGTVAYMSPEQAHGGAVDAQTDIWSLGMVLYEMLTGTRPFAGEHEQAIIYQLLNEEPPSITEINPALPQELDHVVAMCLEKEKDLRYPTMADLLADLEVLTQSTEAYTEGFTVSRTSAAERIRQRKQKRQWRALGLAGVGVLTVLLAVLAMGFFRQPALPTKQHLAVLPFSIAEAGLVEQAFADGLVEAFRSLLAQLERTQDSLWVESSQTMRQYPAGSPDEARQLFGVNLAVEGRIEPVGEGIRLALALVDTKTRQTLRSSEITGGDTRAAVFQAGLVTAVSDLLDLDLPPEVRRVLNTGGTTQSEAYVFYVQGQGYLQRYDQVNQIDIAITLFEEALQEDSAYALAYAGLGEAYWRKFDKTLDVRWLDLADQNCERALELDRALAPVYVTRGLIDTKRGQYGSARFMFEQALDRDPASATAYQGLARVYEALGDVEAAEAAYQTAISLKRDYWGGYNELGKFYFNSKSEYQKAAEQFQQVINLTPDNPLGYNNLGSAYRRLGRPQDATLLYLKSIEVHPTEVAYRNLGAIYYSESKYADAVAMYEKALELRVRSYRDWSFLADAQFWSGQRAEARRTWQRVIELATLQLDVNAQDAEALGHLADAYAKQGGHEPEARAMIERLLALRQLDNDDLASIARTYEHLGERDLALQYLEQALKNGLTLVAIESSPYLSALRDDPRYKEMKKLYQVVRE